MVKIPDTAEDWATEAAACEMLAFSLRYPTEQLAIVLASREWAAAAIEMAEVFGFDMPEGWKVDVEAAAGEEGVQMLVHRLRTDATRLFVGSPEPACSPYEGVWRAADDGVEPLLFVNPHSMAVERFCKSCGLGRPQGTNEPLDHAATELELMQYLASLAAGITDPAETSPANDALPGGSPAAAYAQFAEEHPMKWMQRFAESVAEKARTPFYRATAQLLGAYLAR